MAGPVRAWAMLVALTAATGAALATGEVPEPAWIIAIAAVTVIKGRLVLFDYLELRAAAGWRDGILAAFAASVVVVAGLLLAGG